MIHVMLSPGNYGPFFIAGAQLLLPCIGMLAQHSPRGWIITLSLMAFVSLIAWSSALRRRRLLTDTPSSRIASAAQGYAAISGAARPPAPPLLSFLSHRPCLWYRYLVQEDWRTLDSGESDVPFVIHDGSGECLIDPEGAEILTRHKKSWARGVGKSATRYTEWFLLDNDPIYALGEFRTRGGAAQEFSARQDLNLLLEVWKKDQSTLLRRFDLDRDGQLNEKEWELARRAARREVAKTHREARDQAHLHTLDRPRNGRLYLLSNIDPKRLARRYLAWSVFHLALFLVALGAIPWQMYQSAKTDVSAQNPQEAAKEWIQKRSENETEE